MGGEKERELSPGPGRGPASPGASHTRFPAPALPLPLLSVHLLASTVQLMQGSRHAEHKRDGAVGAGGGLTGRGIQDGHGVGAGIAPRLDGMEDPGREKREGGHRGGRARASPPGQVAQRVGVGVGVWDGGGTRHTDGVGAGRDN